MIRYELNKGHLYCYLNTFKHWLERCSLSGQWSIDGVDMLCNLPEWTDFLNTGDMQPYPSPHYSAESFITLACSEFRRKGEGTISLADRPSPKVVIQAPLMRMRNDFNVLYIFSSICRGLYTVDSIGWRIWINHLEIITRIIHHIFV